MLLPNTAAALAAGAISGRHAAVIADGVKDAPAGAVALIEPEVVAAAAEGDVRATANIMRAFGQALDPDKADAKALRRYERAGITFSPMLDGGFAITGTADETTGAAIIAAIDTAAPLTTRRHPHRGPPPPRRPAHPRHGTGSTPPPPTAPPPSPAPGAPAGPGPDSWSPSTPPA